MFDTIAPRYDLVNRIMTLGLDQGWRRATVASLGLPEGSVLLDLACGTGDLSRIAVRDGYRVIGADLSMGMLTANSTGLALLEADAAAMPFPDASLDGVLCGYALRNFTDLALSLREIGRVVRPGGRIALLEVAQPPRGLLRTGHAIWFERVVPVLGGALSDRDAYHYLPRSTAYLPKESDLRQLLINAGFATVTRRLLHGGLSQRWTATKVGMPAHRTPAAA
jgi:demethylmenaquinone methyltransferase/2-methoxy-6-polyprenyl-1,4-benzoquinol methylase